MSGHSPSLILATSNGTGMGHLARQLAVGLAVGQHARVTLFSLSVALPQVSAEGIPGEYCPGPDRDWIPERAWAHYLADRLTALAEQVEADVVVFDGVAPYRGVALAKRRLPETAFVWFRRGMWRPGVNEGQLWKSGLFDRIIEPGDLGSSGDRGATAGRGDAVGVPPVSLLEVVSPVSRHEARERLSIAPDRPALLVTLGAGRLGEMDQPGQVVLDALTQEGAWQACVATSAIARSEVSTSSHSGVVELRGVFPLVRYLSAFDAVVSAAGYNAVHEYVASGIPTLLVPNQATRTDDQVARATAVADRGLALTPKDAAPQTIATAVRRLIDEKEREELHSAFLALPAEDRTGGAAETGRALVELAHTYTPVRRSMRARLGELRGDSKEALKRRLGPSQVNRVRRLLGRPAGAVSSRLKVSVDSDFRDPGARPLRLTSDVTVEMLLGANPVEHLLAGASMAYEGTRRLLIDRYYDVVS